MTNPNSQLDSQNPSHALAHMTPDEEFYGAAEHQAELEAANEGEPSDDGHMYPPDEPFDEYLHGGE